MWVLGFTWFARHGLLCSVTANIRMSQKVAKPTLTGQRIKTRKRGKVQSLIVVAIYFISEVDISIT